MIFKIMVMMGTFLLINISAVKISDVSSADPAYPAIKRSLDKGYFSLLDGTSFLPNQKISRREMSLILDRLDQLNDKAALSSDDVIQLKGFSKQFRDYLASQQNSKGLVDSEVTLIKTEQKTINYDLSRIDEHLQLVEKRRKEQEVYIWIGIGLGLLGLM